jgi:hypothetical protein
MAVFGLVCVDDIRASPAPAACQSERVTYPSLHFTSAETVSCRVQVHIATDFRIAGGGIEKRSFAERICVIEIVLIGDPIAEIADVVAIQ